MGSLAAGSAAAMGTGAMDAMEMDRNATGEIVGDGSAYIALGTGYNDEFASIDGGQLELDFGGEVGPYGGEGLNQDSVNHFHQVFSVTAQENGKGGFDLYFTAKNSDVLQFYWGSDPSDSAMGAQNSKPLNSGSGPSEYTIGVTIDLENVESTGTILGANDDFTIHVDDQ